MIVTSADGRHTIQLGKEIPMQTRPTRFPLGHVLIAAQVHNNAQDLYYVCKHVEQLCRLWEQACQKGKGDYVKFFQIDTLISSLDKTKSRERKKRFPVLDQLKSVGREIPEGEWKAHMNHLNRSFFALDDDEHLYGWAERASGLEALMDVDTTDRFNLFWNHYKRDLYQAVKFFIVSKTDQEFLKLNQR